MPMEYPKHESVEDKLLKKYDTLVYKYPKQVSKSHPHQYYPQNQVIPGQEYELKQKTVKDKMDEIPPNILKDPSPFSILSSNLFPHNLIALKSTTLIDDFIRRKLLSYQTTSK